jgi:hypothetical protein
MIQRTGLLLMSLVLPLGAGCSRATAGQGDRETVYQAETALTIRVVNNSRLDAAIYLVHDGARERMGTVTAVSSASFPLRGRLLATGDFFLVAEPIGARGVLNSERLSAAQGSVFTWTIDADLRRSAVFVQE